MTDTITRTPDQIADEIDSTLDRIDTALCMAARYCFEADELRRTLPDGAQKDKYLDILANVSRRIDTATLALSGHHLWEA